jgi:hypothetical protein
MSKNQRSTNDQAPMTNARGQHHWSLGFGHWSFGPAAIGHCFLVLILFAGCGGSKTSPVSGSVLLDGKPLAGATVQFVPQEGKGRDATGGTDASGHFTMSDGVFPGTYKVVITPATPAAPPVQYATSDEAMSAAAKTPVKKDASNFPQKYARPDQTPLTLEVPPKGSVKFELSSK